uniref:DUF4371 domain-containing protein n=1 Tax=Pundamilia nyererei TaxID=303518 RepID=A0A3B4FQX6_9CICH
MVERKVDSENRAFQRQWVTEYMFTDIAGNPVCLISGANVAVINNGLDLYSAFQGTQSALQFHYSFTLTFIHWWRQRQSNQPGTTLKSCMMNLCDILCPDKTQSLANVSLSRNTIADRLCERSKNFIAYSLAVDIAQLAIFIRGEEILNIKSMHGTTTGKDIFLNVCQSVADMKLPWDKLVGLTTDGAQVLCGEKSGLVGRMRVKMQEENCTDELTAYHCITHQERLCGKVLKMEHVMITVTLNHRQFQSFMWEIDSEFADIPHHTEVPQQGNLSVHGHGMYDAVKAFQVTLSRMHQCNLPHFPCCQVILNQIQMELQCNDTLKGKYDTEWPAQFISSFPEAIPSSVYMRLEPCVCFHLFFLGFLAACSYF